MIKHLCAMLLLAFVSEAAWAQDLGVITSLRGNVSVERELQTHASDVAAGFSLQNFDRVTTGALPTSRTRNRPLGPSIAARPQPSNASPRPSQAGNRPGTKRHGSEPGMADRGGTKRKETESFGKFRKETERFETILRRAGLS